MKKISYKIAFCGMMTALGLVFLLTAGLIPGFEYAVPLYASFVLIPVLDEFGVKEGLMVWVATGILGFFLIPNKEVSLFYIFIGYWPALRIKMFSVKKPVVREIIKFIIATVAVFTMYAVLLYVFALEDVVKDFNESSKLLIYGSNMSMVLIIMFYDKILAKMELFYKRVVKKKFKGLGRYK